MISPEQLWELIQALPPGERFEDPIRFLPSMESVVTQLDRYANAINHVDRNRKAQKDESAPFRTHLPLLFISEAGTEIELLTNSLRRRMDARTTINHYYCGTAEPLLRFTESLIASDGQMLFLHDLERLDYEVQLSLDSFLEHGTLDSSANPKNRIDTVVLANSLRSIYDLGRMGFKQTLLAKFGDLAQQIPALRERRRDIPTLTQYFLYDIGHHLYGLELNVSKNIHLDAMCRLVNYDWPTNAEQLKAFIRTAIVNYFVPTADYVIQHDELPLYLRGPANETATLEDFTSILSPLNWPAVNVAWRKAVERVESDPTGAITGARTLIESVCKHILVNRRITYSDDGDLPRLYKATIQNLKLSPDLKPTLDSEELFRQVTGGCFSVAQGVAAIRNAYGDAHGASPEPSFPTVRHARFAVNCAGALAIFLIETHLNEV